MHNSCFLVSVGDPNSYKNEQAHFGMNFYRLNHHISEKTDGAAAQGAAPSGKPTDKPGYVVG